MSHLEKNQLHTVTITGYSADGMGIARVDQQVVFVHGAVRGETCVIRILKVLKNVAFARVEEIIERSEHRIEPDCPNFPACGGCDFRHLAYGEELEAKRMRVQDALQRIGGVNIEVTEILGSEETTAYRNKSQFPVSASGRVGFYRARSHDVIPTTDCRLLPPQAGAVARAVEEYLREYSVAAYDEKRHTGLLRHIYVRTNCRGEALVCLIVNGKKLPHEQELVRRIRSSCETTVGVVLNSNTKETNVILGDTYRTLWGEDTLMDTLCGFTFRLSIPAFYQVNRSQAQRLYAKAIELAQLSGEETVLDLYCGAGTITLALAAKAGRVIGAEIVPEAIENAKENAARNGVTNAEFFCGDAGDIAAKLVKERLRPDVVVVDPPRKGLDEQVIAAIEKMKPQRVVYVSCDCATLARDVKRFGGVGYEINTAVAVDMFPRTCHIESIACLSKREANRTFRKARQEDVQQILALYQSAKNDAFSVWNENYPGMLEIEHDLETNNLYVLTRGNKIIGAISVVPENELEEFPCWSCKIGNEIARVVVAGEDRGQGLGFEMVEAIASLLRESGSRAIHLSVAKCNIPAYQTYIKAGFTVAGEAQKYGNDYYLMEKAIGTDFPSK